MKRSLLIVDDIPEVTEFVKDALRADYEVTRVTTGKDAIRLLQSNQYELLITDVALPDMSVEDLTTTAKEVRPNLPVLVMTASGSIESATKLMRMGAYDYVEKPFSIEKLKHTIDKALEFNTLRRQNRTLQAQLEDQGQQKVLVGNSVIL